jgi:uncharacterized protein YutE (UPF0331/DUF86 family)
LRRCIQRIEAKRPPKVEDLKNDYDAQDIIALNLTRAVQLSVDIAAHLIASRDAPVPMTMAESFDTLVILKLLSPELALRLKRAVGFRNIVVHAYQQIDWEIVHTIIHNHLRDFKAFAQTVMASEG